MRAFVCRDLCRSLNLDAAVTVRRCCFPVAARSGTEEMKNMKNMVKNRYSPERLRCYLFSFVGIDHRGR